MKPVPLPGEAGSGTSDRARRAAAALLAAGILAMVGQVAAEGEVAAVYKVREVSFSYRSAVTVYPCYEIESLVKGVLRALGARDGVRVSANDCDQFVGAVEDPTLDSTWQSPSDRFQSPSDRFLDRGRANREQLVHLRVRLMMPVEVTPEVVKELEKDQSRRELVSRVTGDPTASRDLPVVFPARWQPITLSRRSGDLEPKDCELLEQMSRSVLPRLGLRVVRRPSCDRYGASSMPPQLTVEALTPVEMTALPEVPPAAESASDPSAPASDTQPSDTQPYDTQPSDAQPSDTQPSDIQPSEPEAAKPEQ